MFDPRSSRSDPQTALSPVLAHGGPAAQVFSAEAAGYCSPDSAAHGRAGTRPALGRAAHLLLLVALHVQILHVALHLFWTRPAFVADLMQSAAALLSVAVCVLMIRKDPGQQHLWTGLAAAFAIWTMAALVYTFNMLRPGVTHVVFSEFLWLIYAFPLLLVTLYKPQHPQRALAEYFDAAQAGVFFLILIALFFPPPGLITQAISDEVQGIALLLAVVLRYCLSAPGRDRLFFRNLTVYMAVYLGFCVLYYSALERGAALGSVFELCWSLPFTFFSVLTLASDFDKAALAAEQDKRGQTAPASYAQGASAVGLGILSLTAAAVLTFYRPLDGTIALVVSFLLFAARTIARERQLQAAHLKLNHSVLHDPLTSLANRALLEQEINRRLSVSRTAAGDPLCVMFVGLDRFKTLNDCLGHVFGDLLLQYVARLLAHGVRKQDLVARYGGDEFVILLDATAREASLFADRTLETLRTPVLLEGRILNVTASIGFAHAAPGATAASLVQEAHFALHHAKKAGRDRVQSFEMEMVRVPQFRLGLEADLRVALAEDQVSVAYQPIFSLEDQRLVGFEALARWRHPQRGDVAPEDFIPVAEDTGLILALGERILRLACRQCRLWNQQFGTRYTINVNVSAHQFASPLLLSQIVSALYEAGLEPSLLKLEITESVLISGFTGVEEILRKIQKLGVQICLDDFGTGYSSLSYLLNYPFDGVKIDQSFVRQLDKDAQRADVVRTLVHLAASLHKDLVAEGVERPEEMACLKEFGCELAQGFLLSKPLAAQAMEALLLVQQGDAAAWPMPIQKATAKPMLPA